MPEVPPWKQNSQKSDYLKLIHQHFPQVKYKQSRILRHGYDHDVVILDEKLVFRFPREAYLKQFQSEVVLLNAIQDAITLRVPFYEHLSSDNSFGGYEKINGSPLSFPAFKRLHSANKMAIAEQLGQFMTELHSTPKSIVEKAQFNTDPSKGWWSKAKCQLDYDRIKVELLPKLDQNEAKWIVSKYEAYLSLSSPKTSVLVHADLSGDHILYDKSKNRLVGVIDFADSEWGDPSLDFVGLWKYGTKFVQDVFAHYKLRTDSDFLERSKYPSQLAPVPHLLDKKTSETQYYSFEENLKRLRDAMIKYPID